MQAKQIVRQRFNHMPAQVSNYKRDVDKGASHTPWLVQVPEKPDGGKRVWNERL